MSRVIKFNGKTLPDPGEDFTPEQIRELYKGQFPELASAKVRTREEDGITVVEFTHQAGTKG